MFSFLINLFKPGSSATEKVLDGAIAGIDKIFLTNEERLDARQKLVDGWIELQKSLGDESTTRSITRRILAILIIIPYITLVLLSAIFFKIDIEYSKFLLELGNGNFGLMALGVAAFYFGPYMLSYLTRK